MRIVDGPTSSASSAFDRLVKAHLIRFSNNSRPGPKPQGPASALTPKPSATPLPRWRSSSRAHPRAPRAEGGRARRTGDPRRDPRISAGFLEVLRNGVDLGLSLVVLHRLPGLSRAYALVVDRRAHANVSRGRERVANDRPPNSACNCWIISTSRCTYPAAPYEWCSRTRCGSLQRDSSRSVGAPMRRTWLCRANLGQRSDRPRASATNSQYRWAVSRKVREVAGPLRRLLTRAVRVLPTDGDVCRFALVEDRERLAVIARERRLSAATRRHAAASRARAGRRRAGRRPPRGCASSRSPAGTRPFPRTRSCPRRRARLPAAPRPARD